MMLIRLTLTVSCLIVLSLFHPQEFLLLQGRSIYFSLCYHICIFGDISTTCTCVGTESGPNYFIFCVSIVVEKLYKKLTKSYQILCLLSVFISHAAVPFILPAPSIYNDSKSKRVWEIMQIGIFGRSRYSYRSCGDTCQIPTLYSAGNKSVIPGADSVLLYPRAAQLDGVIYTYHRVQPKFISIHIQCKQYIFGMDITLNLLLYARRNNKLLIYCLQQSTKLEDNQYTQLYKTMTKLITCVGVWWQIISISHIYTHKHIPTYPHKLFYV